MLIEPWVVPMFVTEASPEVFQYALDFFLVTIPFYPALGLLLVYRTADQALGISWAPFAACILELAARCFASLGFGTLFGYKGVIFASPFAWLLASALVTIVYFCYSKRLGKEVRKPAAL